MGRTAGHIDGADRFASEGRKVGFHEHVADIDDFQRVAQVGLVGAVFQHAFRIGYFAEGRGRYPLIGEFGKRFIQDFFRHGKHILLRGERHFKVELVKLAGRPVGPRILVPEAGGYLEILVKPRYHEQLLENLGRLWQRIKHAVMLAAGN